MQLLLDPNFAYLVIVFGFLLTIFAILTPGTGVIELGVLFALVIAGWQIYNMPINIWALAALGSGLIPFVQVVRGKNRRVYLGLTMITFVFGSVFLFRGDAWYQPAVNLPLAIVVTGLAGGLIWVMTDKILEARAAPPSHDLSGLIGAIGTARTDIHAEGSVFVMGELWTGRSTKKIKSGAKVEVVAREGFSLDVKEV